MNMNLAFRLGRTVALLPVALIAPLAAAERSPLMPIMAVRDQVVLHEEFETAKPLAKGVFTKRQGTQWAVDDGVLRGQPSTAEFRATKKDHFGYEPRLSIPACPQEFIVEFDVRSIGGQSTAIVPFIELGHHVVRLTWAGGEGAKLIADHESVLLAEADGFKLEPRRWYHAMAEIKGNECVIQFADGPTLYGKHESLAGKKDGFGIAGNKDGTIELDNLTVWSINSEPQPTWESTRALLPKPKHVQLKKPAPKR